MKRIDIPEYRVWQHMKARCNNPNDHAYKNYGGRGIRMHKDWENDFDAFFNYIGNRPSIQYSIDRHPNNDGNYEPGNIRWATMKEQCRNRRNNRWLKIGDEMLLPYDAADKLGVSQPTIYNRLRSGCDIAKSRRGRIVINIETGIFYDSIKEAARTIGVTATYLSYMVGGHCKNKTSFMYT